MCNPFDIPIEYYSLPSALFVGFLAYIGEIIINGPKRSLIIYSFIYLGITVFILILLWTPNIGPGCRPKTPTPVPTAIATDTPTTTPLLTPTTQPSTSPNIAVIVVAVPFQQPPISTPISLPRCAWLEKGLPQIAERIAQKFNLPASRVQILNQSCGTIADGFFVRGNNNSQINDTIELQVPDGGCIDAPPHASFSGETQSKPWGMRAYSGTVRSSIMTYYPWCDERYFLTMYGSG